MAQRVRRRQDDDCAARSAHASLRNHRDRKRELALQAPRLSRCTAPACPGGQTGTSRAALRRTRGGHSAPRGSLLFATGTSLNRRPRGVTIGRRSGVKLQRRLTLEIWRGSGKSDPNAGLAERREIVAIGGVIAEIVAHGEISCPFDAGWITAHVDCRLVLALTQINHVPRSEERRVGKECRSRWS